ncbi:MAG: hypothetical protein JXR10_10165 [Cyclobacteriaceae bacterium]
MTLKKFIRPPENWQDFETLCKKLFGEIWGCPMTIKKNGRLGQPQSGVDVFGKPKDNEKYWGIQCKGKDNYTKAHLTKSEIDEEIKKALQFEPQLETFVFATTAAKDVEIEKYIRLKDQESCKNGKFQIVLFSWQDIADLIEENRDTFNWYVNEIQFKDKYDIEVSFRTEYENDIITPKFLKVITDFKLRTESIDYNPPFIISPSWMKYEPVSLFGSNKIDHGWCSFDTHIKNSGSMVIEDWKFWIEFRSNVRKIDDDFTNDIFMYEKLAKYRTTWAYEEDNEILYKPLNNAPLIQKDTKSFKSYFIPEYDSDELVVYWRLLARDFDREGEFKLKIEPQYEIERITQFVSDSNDVRSVEEIEDYITTREKEK